MNDNKDAPKKVYIVVRGEDYEGDHVEGVFTTMNKASNFVKDALLPQQYKYQEWEKEEEEGDSCEWYSCGCDYIGIFPETLDYNWIDDISS